MWMSLVVVKEEFAVGLVVGEEEGECVFDMDLVCYGSNLSRRCGMSN